MGIPELNIVAWSGELKKIHPTPDPSVFPKIDVETDVYYSLDAELELTEVLLENRRAKGNTGMDYADAASGD